MRIKLVRRSLSVLGLSWIAAAQLCAQMQAPAWEAAVAHVRAGQAQRALRVSAHADGGGIKEDIPAKYLQRFQEWKSEFLATDFGQAQWDLYGHSTNFTLTITVSSANRNGAETSKYHWDDAGTLVAATITLGSKLDEGYPTPIYYPVMNALAPQEASYGIDGNVLAAAKLAHEFGHVKQVSNVDGVHYRLQNQLMLGYNKILLSNGRNTADPRLLDLARQMGGTPVEIWEDREYWGEANAMLYLRDRIKKESDRRVLFARIIHTVEEFATTYVERFNQIAQ